MSNERRAGRRPTQSIVVTGAVVAILMFGAPAGAGAWGFDAHRYVTNGALSLLPPELQPFFHRHRAWIAEHVIDPDMWRAAGFEEEGARHYFHVDVYAADRLSELPATEAELVARFGAAHVQRNGVLPWRALAMYDRLVAAFQQAARSPSYRTLADIRFFTAVLSHYVGDAHVPFHAVSDYDGNEAGQPGIHARFEATLFARQQHRLVVKPPALRRVDRPLADLLETLAASAAAVPDVLAADREAIGDGEWYDEAYMDRFFTRARPILEGRLAASMSSIASYIVSAWEQAGRPVIPPEPPAVPERRRR